MLGEGSAMLVPVAKLALYVDVGGKN